MLSEDEKKLFDAVDEDDMNSVKTLCENGVNINCLDSDGRTPIFLAGVNENFDIVKYLGDRNANLDIVDHQKGTLVLIAAYHGNLQLLKYLCEKNANLDCRHRFGETPIHFAIISGNIDAVKMLCEQEDVDLNCLTKDGCTPIHYAAAGGFVDIVEYLCEKNVNLECKDSFGHTPVHKAVIHGHLNVLEYLCEKQHANVDDLDAEGKTILHLAHEYAKSDIINYSQNQIFRLPVWNPSSKSKFQCKILEPKIEEILNENISEKSIMCNIKDFKGVHIAEKSIKLDCGHNVCITCLLKKTSRSTDEMFFCCLKYVKKICFDDLTKYCSHLSDCISQSSVTSVCQGILLSYSICSQRVSNKMDSYENLFNYIEENFLIRYDSINEALNKLKKKFNTYLYTLKSQCKSAVNGKGSNEYQLIEKLCFLDKAFTTKQVPPNKIRLKQFGSIKSIERYLSSWENGKFVSEKNIDSLVDSIYCSNDVAKEPELLRILWDTVQYGRKFDFYLIREIESLVKITRTNDDLKELYTVLEYICSHKSNQNQEQVFEEFLKNNQEPSEIENMMKTYLLEIKRKLLEQFENNNETLINEILQKLFLICISF